MNKPVKMEWRTTLQMTDHFQFLDVHDLVCMSIKSQNINVKEFYFALNKSMFDGFAVPCMHTGI